jgi:hypothetical protein
MVQKDISLYERIRFSCCLRKHTSVKSAVARERCLISRHRTRSCLPRYSWFTLAHSLTLSTSVGPASSVTAERKERETGALGVDLNFCFLLKQTLSETGHFGRDVIK